jgi:LysM repeat protein
MRKLSIILVLILVLLTITAAKSSGSALGREAGKVSLNQNQVFLIQAAFETSTPDADGTIYHTVQEGDTIITIAQAYGISGAELLAINGLTADSVIFPGNRLIISRGPTLTPTLDITDTPTPTQTQPATQTPTPFPTRTPTGTASPLPPTPSVTPVPGIHIGDITLGVDPFLIVIGALAVSGVALMGFGTLLKKRQG